VAPGAQAEQMLSRWYQEDAASAGDADVHLEQRRSMRRACAAQRRHLPDRLRPSISTGDHRGREAAHRLTSEMIPLAEQAGVDVGRAMMMIFHGSHRAGSAMRAA
jgi:hypothetical protein